MIDPNKYLKIVEMIKSIDDMEVIEAFLYNRGKIVIDKKDLYEQYSAEEIREISDKRQKVKKINPCRLGFGRNDDEKNDDECFR
jgi:hypothetical protein